MEECQNQVKDQLKEEKLFFCLVIKEFLDSCPPKCPYYVRGSSIPMDFIYQSNIEMECTYLHMIACIAPQDERQLICGRIASFTQCEKCPLTLISNKKNY